MRTLVTKSISLALTAAAVISVGAAAQTPPPVQAASAFEVASIRKNVSVSDDAWVRAQPGGRLTVSNNTLRNIIRNAYTVQDYQIVGGPDWMNTERWDITAKAAEDTSPAQMLLLVRTLLAERFTLVIRHETREQPMFALVLARTDGRLGPQLRASPVDCAALFAAAKARGAQPPATTNGRPTCGSRTSRGNMMTTATPMADFARNIARFTGRPVVDRTGLTGSYDIDLAWTPEEGPPSADAAPPPGDGVSLFTALQEQLGLKLDAQHGPVDVLVIESVEPPTED
jgi:uncharacterized protein (TIGR03435 family)